MSQQQYQGDSLNPLHTMLEEQYSNGESSQNGTTAGSSSANMLDVKTQHPHRKPTHILSALKSKNQGHTNGLSLNGSVREETSRNGFTRTTCESYDLNSLLASTSTAPFEGFMPNGHMKSKPTTPPLDGYIPDGGINDLPSPRTEAQVLPSPQREERSLSDVYSDLPSPIEAPRLSHTLPQLSFEQPSPIIPSTPICASPTTEPKDYLSPLRPPSPTSQHSLSSEHDPSLRSSSPTSQNSKPQSILRKPETSTSLSFQPSPRKPTTKRARSTSHGQKDYFTLPVEEKVEGIEDSIAREAEEMRKERQSRRGGGTKRNSSQSEGDSDAESRRGEKEKVEAVPMDRALVGNLIGEDHVNYVLMYNMLTGIRIGVSRCQAKIKRPLTDEDYTARHKFSFDIIGNELTPSARYDFKFKDYAPWIFRELREYFHLDPADYLLSLTAKYILSELGSPGKSGSFFYFSRDYRFIIKTIRHSEHKFLRKILKQYHEHVKANPHTLISRFYGLHRVKLPRGRKIHFVIMNNLMPPHRDIHETYDLKGSTVSRETPEEKLKQNPGATQKDLNWLKRGRQLELGPEKKALFTEQLKSDTAFMQMLGIMDYSLLVGVHDGRRGNSEKIRENALTMFNPDTQKLRRRPTQIQRERDKEAHEMRQMVARSDPKAISETNRLPDRDRSERRHFIFYQDEGGYAATDDNDYPMDTIYYLGIIDILTPFGCMKWFENFFKGFVHDKKAISPVPPQYYGERFLRFMISIQRGNASVQETIEQEKKGEKAE